MLTRAQEKLIKSLHRKKGRVQSGLCLVEGLKVIGVAASAVDYVFTKEDSLIFDKLVTTETPQDAAAVAQIPRFTPEDVLSSETILLLDGLQDPGNVGGIFRLCQGFGASLILVESADPTSSKVIRASVGSMFSVPWITVSRPKVSDLIERSQHDVLRLESPINAAGSFFQKEGKVDYETDSFKNRQTGGIELFATKKPAMLIVGSEGRGIQLPVKAPSVSISHDKALESLNVGHAVAIALHERYNFLNS
jgi:tRNA G18 (ribose-2'-O)-methylase SpoU